MTNLYVTPSGKYYITYQPINGTYDVREWPSGEWIANRDWKSDAVEIADRLEEERT